MYPLSNRQVVESCQCCPLRSDGFFCHLSPAALKTWDSIKYVTTYPANAALFMEGQEPRGVFMLCRGRVKLSMTSSDGKSVILRIVSPGEMLGLHGVFSQMPYQATAETVEPCQVTVVKREDFMRFLRAHGEAFIQVAQQLTQSYQAACHQIRTLGLTHSVPEKLAVLLLDWSTRGQETQQGVRVKVTLTHDEIGQMIGATRETVTRTLGEFRSRRIATLTGSTLLIQNKAALQSLVTV
jgi:CRP/FNR family cyclic AMP-dependent transcriptional regulator